MCEYLDLLLWSIFAFVRYISLTLQQFNLPLCSMNMHALVTTHIRDEIVNTNHICAADHESYIKTLPDKDQKLIATVRRKNAKGAEPWYPLTRRYLGMLVFDVRFCWRHFSLEILS